MTAANSANQGSVHATLEVLSGLAREIWKNCSSWTSRDKGSGRFDPVTELDEAIEQAMRAAIRARFPDDSIWGEEGGRDDRNAERVWSLDPVDGTRSLICGLPSWAVLVGVMERGQHVAGLIDFPALDECLIASAGRTVLNGEAVRTSGCQALGAARLSSTDPDLFEGTEARQFAKVRAGALVTRYGLDALAYARVATGGLDLVVEHKLARHDLDALVAVVRGAGGHIGDWSGREDWEGGRIVAASSKTLYDEAVALLSA